jgi:hypothetical protein
VVDSHAETEALTARLSLAAERLKARPVTAGGSEVAAGAPRAEALAPALAELEAAGRAVRDVRRRLAELASSLLAA